MILGILRFATHLDRPVCARRTALAGRAVQLEGYAPPGGRHRRRGAHADRPLRRIAQKRPPGRARRGGRDGGDGARAASPADAIDEVLIGHGRQAGSGPNPARQVGIRAGIPDTVPAQTINKACASGMQTIATGAQSIMLGEADVVLAGGIESMSRMPYLIDAEDARWGHKMGNFTLVDAMYRDGFTCSVCGMIMGETAEVLAREYGITREESDAYALESQQRAERAIAAGRFRDEIAPVTVTDAKGKAADARRRRAPARRTRRSRRCASCRSPSRRSRGSRASSPRARRPGITDGGAAVVLMSAATREGARPASRWRAIIGWASAGVDPRIMGIGPVPAVQKLLEQDRADARRLRSRRAERSVRRAGARRPARTCRSRRRS